MTSSQRVQWWPMGWMAKILHRGRNATAPQAVFRRIVLTVVTVLSVMAPPALAQMAAPPPGERANLEVFLVEDIAVDATAGNAVAAREAALADGQQRALRTLLERLTPESAHAALPRPTANEVSFMVLGVSINEERTSAIRYVGNINVQFIPNAVTALLDQVGVTYAVDSRPVLVLPVYRESADASAVLWEEPNPWRHLWASRQSSGLVALQAPQGDLDDITVIDVKRAIDLDMTALAILTDRYAAAETIVAQATMGTGPNGEPVVALAATRGDGSVLTASVPGVAGEPQDATLGRAADALNALLEGGWKQEALSYAGPTTALTVMVPIQSLEDWLTVRAKLQALPQIRDLQVQAISREGVQAILHYSGDLDGLATLLGDRGLGLESRPGYAVLRRGVVGMPRSSSSMVAPLSRQPAPVQGNSPAVGGGLSDGQTIVIQ